MARRKKAPEGYHREQIANTAANLFQEKGIGMTSMDEIAKCAGYSKATIYVYFKDKNELIDALALRSMHMLHAVIQGGITSCTTAKDRFYTICSRLETFKVQHPLYFDLASKNIRFDIEQVDTLQHEIYTVGEIMIQEISAMIEEGKHTLELREDIEVSSCVFTLWASLIGVITMVEQKQRYIEVGLKQTKEQFLKQCFDTIYESICRR